MSHRRNTKQLILDHAEALFRERSFRGFSYKDISRQLGIKNAAIHYHYPAKADLGLALIQRFRRAVQKKASPFLQRGGDPKAELESYFDFELQECNTAVCPLGMIATDFYHLPDKMRDHGRRLAGEIQGWLTRILELGRNQGVFCYAGTPTDKAVQLMASLQGARQLARLSGADTLHRAIDQIRRDLGVSLERRSP